MYFRVNSFMLIFAFVEFSMQTWRKQQPSFLCPVMSQKKSTCYAIAYVRQLEFHLKLHNRMPQDQHLSIQDFINRIPKEYLGADGELIVDSSRVLPILVEKGILLERDCPLTERIDDTVSEETVSHSLLTVLTLLYYVFFFFLTCCLLEGL